MIWNAIAVGVLAVVLVAAAVSDLARGKVFNWLTYPAIAVGLGLGALAGAAEGDAWEGLSDRALGFGFGFGVLFVAYLLGGMGGGDVKLTGAVGALVGWHGVAEYAALHAVFYSFLAAAATGLILVVWRGEMRTVLRKLYLAVRILPLPKATVDEAAGPETFRVPFGFAVCLGTFWFLAETWLGTSLWEAVGRLV
ncbi:MAG: prepilin peptidase [Planctomycetes bacterium]|nr:prepilin peptidase [Planctomycetota bacterium]